VKVSPALSRHKRGKKKGGMQELALKNSQQEGKGALAQSCGQKGARVFDDASECLQEKPIVWPGEENPAI